MIGEIRAQKRQFVRASPHGGGDGWPWYLRSRIVYFSTLFIASSYILVIFFTPTTAPSVGMNQFCKAMFMDMVHGTAYKPFVYRTLLPTTIRTISMLTPVNIHVAITAMVEQRRELMSAFRTFHWQTSAAYEYLVAALLMDLCLIGFAHYTAQISLQICEIPDGFVPRLTLAILSLMALPPFFYPVAYPYDPPQLFLFTLALYFCANHHLRGFFVTFLLCCFNKETAVLLIPVFMLTNQKKHTNRVFWSALFGLTSCYIVVQGLLKYLFWFNPGSFVEFHLRRNIFQILIGGWSFTDVVVCLVLAFLVFLRWNEKPTFLRVSFFWVLCPLAILGLFLGFAGEWRDYYEVYPIAFALMTDSVYRIKSISRQSPTNLVSLNKTVRENQRQSNLQSAKLKGEQYFCR